MTQRALIISHAHPDFSKGGAEVAAYNLYRALRDTPGWDAHFLARHANAGYGRANVFAGHNDRRETLFAGVTDPFNFSIGNPRTILPAFREFLDGVRPTVVHMHHYWQLGVELIAEVKRWNPDVPVVVTLHEFLAICNQNGQMLKSSGELCRKSSPGECNSCMPQRSPREYFLRRRYVQAFFNQADAFVSPSAFLRQRYVDWGLPAERISVIENGLPAHVAKARAPEQPHEGERVVRIGFFGQINPFKGVDVLLEAAAQLPKVLQKKLHIEIHGGGLEVQPPEFQAKFQKLLADAPKCVRYYGPYSQDDVANLMGNVDWVVMPSIWWENSPVVIQEAFKFGRPIICGDIGGMAEKVQHGVNGLHFHARNSIDLARTLRLAVETPGLWDTLRKGIPAPRLATVCAREHVELYTALAPKSDARRGPRQPGAGSMAHGAA